MGSIQNTHNHSFLIEEIRRTLWKLERTRWNVVFSWAKSHVRITGNELADQLAKAAARDTDKKISYNRTPKNTIYKELEDEAMTKWQKAWEGSPKAALTRQFFPSIYDRIKAKLQVTPNFTALITGHGKTRAYLHRFKLLGSPECPCGKEDQNADHLIFRCNILQQQRETLKKETTKLGPWPPNKQELINKYLKQFMNFANSIDFELLQ